MLSSSRGFLDSRAMERGCLDRLLAILDISIGNERPVGGYLPAIVVTFGSTMSGRPSS